MNTCTRAAAVEAAKRQIQAGKGPLVLLTHAGRPRSPWKLSLSTSNSNQAESEYWKRVEDARGSGGVVLWNLDHIVYIAIGR